MVEISQNFVAFSEYIYEVYNSIRAKTRKEVIIIFIIVAVWCYDTKKINNLIGDHMFLLQKKSNM